MEMNCGIRGVITIINDVMYIFLFLYYGRKCEYHNKGQNFIKLNTIPSGEVNVQQNIKHE
jgi:hypothetical protein